MLRGPFNVYVKDIWHGFNRQSSSLGILASEEFTSPTAPTETSPVALVLHGLLGQGKNWRTLSRQLAASAKATSGIPWRVFTLDLRCHGASSRVPGLHPPHDMENSARDVLRFVQQRLRGQWPEVICGHSLGGKVALEYVRQVAAGHDADARLPHHAWVLDSQPGTVPAELVPDVTRVLEAVKEVPVPLPSRAALIARLRRSHRFSEGLTQWLASNLVPLPGGANGELVWAFDGVGAAAMYGSYRRTSYWDLLMRPPVGVTVSVLRAGASDRWDAAMKEQLQACAEASSKSWAQGESGQTREVVLADAGHWVHVDQPAALRKMLLDSFSAVTPRR